jgi:hypothetical protein
MKLCVKCEERERVANAYCRSCKNEIDNKSYHKNNSKRKKYIKEYKEKNPEYTKKQKQKSKQWLAKHPDYMNNWMKNKYKTDPNHKIKVVLQASLSTHLHSKKENTIWYLGCTIEEFKKHLESQFIEGMNWENHGQFGWHIDHIKPINTFDLTDDKQLIECWHYTNLRPLWWEENLGRPNNGLDT